MKLAVFRAETDGRRTARRLATLGHEAVLAPVIAVVPTGATVEADGADIVVFTSQHAAEALQAGDLTRLRTLPCFCVGARTAKAAAGAGFSDVRNTAGDGAALAAAIQNEVSSAARIALLAGRDRKPDLEHALARSGYAVSVTEVYAAEPASPWPDGTVHALPGCSGALHYSQRSARLAFAHALNSGLSAWLQAATHYCLSDDIGRWLRAERSAAVRVAPTPNEAALLGLL